MDIVCFLTFNVASMMGNFVTMKAKCPGPGKIAIPVVLRTLFIPILMFCNYMVCTWSWTFAFNFKLLISYILL